MKIKTLPLIRSLLVLGFFAIACPATAQHYQAGWEGIKGGSLPAPGFYLRDYNSIYDGDLATRFDEVTTLPGGQTIHIHGIQHDDFFSYLQAPRLLWMTDWKIFGADYGMDVIVPFGYAEMPVTRTRVTQGAGGRTTTSTYQVTESVFGLGDIELDPLLLSWHKKHFDFQAGYAIWAPTGDFDAGHLSIGKGFWSHMLTVGGVWYPDIKKTWAVSLLDHYEINHEQDRTHITFGNRNTLEWGLSKTVTQGLDLGIVGYYQQAVTRDHGPGTSDQLEPLVGIGPEISVFWSKIDTTFSCRYAYEMESAQTTKGSRINFTVTKKF